MAKTPVRNYPYDYVRPKATDVKSIVTLAIAEAAEPTGDPNDDAGDTDLPLLETLPTAETDVAKVARPDGVGGVTWGDESGGGGAEVGEPETFVALGDTPEDFTLTVTPDRVIVVINGVVSLPADVTLVGDVVSVNTLEDDEVVVWPIMAGTGGGGGGGLTAQPVAIVQRTSDWSTTSTDNIPIEFDTEVKDTGGFYDPGEPTRLTIGADWDGMEVVLTGAGIWDAGTDYKEVKIIRNGDVNDPVAVDQRPGAATGNTGIQLVSHPITVATGDYFELVMKSGSSDTVFAHPGIDGFYSLIFTITVQAAVGGGGGGGPVAAEDVSFDPTGLDNTDATDLQEAIEDLDAAITAGPGGGALTFDSAIVGSDVSLGTGSTDVLVLAGLAAGDYLVNFTELLRCTGGGLQHHYWEITDGSDNILFTGYQILDQAQFYTVSGSVPVTLAAPDSIKLRGYGDSANQVVWGTASAGFPASNLTALKVA